MSNDEDADNTQKCKPLPSRYEADGEEARWNRLWLHRSGGSDDVHKDDDGVDPDQSVEFVLPPLPKNVREEGKCSRGGEPNSDHLRQLLDDQPSKV